MKYFDLTDRWASIKWIWKNEKNVFEKDFAQYIGTKYALGTSYGRTALYLGLRAIDVEDREVLLPSFTCSVVIHAVVMAGAIPKFVDVDFVNFNLNLDNLKGKISSKTKALILTHYFGRVARNIKEVISFARENGIVLIEDCAHSLGAEYNGGKIGTFGDFSIFSLTKNMINFGGGFLTTNNDGIYQKARGILEYERKGLKGRIIDFPIILVYGLEQTIYKLLFDRVGFKKWWIGKIPRILLKLIYYLLDLIRFPGKFLTSKKKGAKSENITDKQGVRVNYYHDISMAPIIASVGKSQFKKIDRLIEQRKKIYERFLQYPLIHFREHDHGYIKDVYTHIVLRFDHGNILEFIDKCKKEGLNLRATWPTRQKKWRHLNSENMSRIEKEILIWNANPDLTDKEIERFIQILNYVNDHRERIQGVEDLSFRVKV
jgi:dTDP-4-amino-4,6-dideoxygalactose transaminase